VLRFWGGRVTCLGRSWSFRLGYPAIILGPLLLASCMVGPDYFRPPAPLPVPDQFKEQKGWKLATPMDALDRGDWWSIYKDKRLNGSNGCHRRDWSNGCYWPDWRNGHHRRNRCHGFDRGDWFNRPSRRGGTPDSCGLR
jgi:hypothetical protein